MNTRIKHVINGEHDNYLFPFFWLAGEEETIIKEYIQKVYDCGIRAICLESRTHPDFLGERWWSDLSFIISECKRLNMKVWILDDAHFPTGYANGAVKEADKKLKKVHLNCNVINVRGKNKYFKINYYSKMIMSGMIGGNTNIANYEVYKIVAAKRKNGQSFEVDGQFIDLTPNIKGAYIEWEVPEGYWSIFIISKELNACAKNNEYINFLQKESVQLFIDTIYEPHYAHLKDEFGDTIAGFFSDEPGFYNNTKGMDTFTCSIGINMPLPFSDEFEQRLLNEYGKEYIFKLPALFYECGEETSLIRYQYMDALTKTYQENFSCALGKWCEERNVEYIGHIIEDNNAHTRLGYGTGHYFRSMTGQHMSGADIVLHQVLPENNYYSKGFLHNELRDGEFFHYGLLHLPSSAAHIDPRYKGRAMCELFGAYGWSEGLSLMKWIADFCLVRGINQYVPHAFSLAEFPATDCPPHFYGRGKNMQYPYMGILFNYMNRVSHLLSNGEKVVDIAILYHAESEWTGDYMYYQTVGKELMQSQIDYDVLSCDYLLQGKMKNGNLNVLNANYKCLIIPKSEKLPIEVIKKLNKLVEEGLKLIFVDNYITSAIEGGNQKLLKDLKEEVSIIELTDIVENMSEFARIKTSEKHENLRVYQYRQGENIIMMFFNENKYNAINTQLTLKKSEIVRYNALNNEFYQQVVEAIDDDLMTFSINLTAFESRIYILGKTYVTLKIEKEYRNERIIDDVFTLYKKNGDLYDKVAELEELKPLHLLIANYSGSVKYHTTFNNISEINEGKISITDVKEVVKVTLNGECLGVQIAPPYDFAFSNKLQEHNNLEIEVVTSMYEQVKDSMSEMSEIYPQGILGDVKIKF